MPVCQFCGSPRTYRSHRRLWELLLPVLRPFRCRACKSRFFAQQPAEMKQRANDELRETRVRPR